MDEFLSVNAGSRAYLSDEVASTCPLLTPSPPTNALVDPLPETPETERDITDELVSKLQHVKNAENGHSLHYHSNADEETVESQIGKCIIGRKEEIVQEINGTVQPVQLSFRNPPDNYFFMSWNWPLIRKISLYFFVSGLVAMVGLVIALIALLPTKCDPVTEWYQGSVFYEISPSKFYDPVHKVHGFKAIASRAVEFEKLGIRAVRLNSVFAQDSQHLSKLAPELGSEIDFKNMARELHLRNISIILDIPVSNLSNFNPNQDAVSKSITKWTHSDYRVDGFFLKKLENSLNNTDLTKYIRHWKKILGQDKILIASHQVVVNSPLNFHNTLLSNIDLIDVKLNVESARELGQQLQLLLNSSIFTNTLSPWIHWTLSSEESPGIKLSSTNGSLGATLLELMLPGTPSVFYHGETSKEETNSNYKKVLKEIISLRKESPVIYMNRINKDGDRRATADVKWRKDLIIIQRWYPRRKTFALVSNLGATKINENLSNLLYSGHVLLTSRQKTNEGVLTFNEMNLWPGDTVIVSLD